MASVIRTLVATAPYNTKALATWWPRAVVRSATKTLAACLRLARGPRSVIVQAHVSEGGSWFREGGIAYFWARVLGGRSFLWLHGADFVDWCHSSGFRRRVARLVLGAA